MSRPGVASLPIRTFTVAAWAEPASAVNAATAAMSVNRAFMGCLLGRVDVG